MLRGLVALWEKDWTEAENYFQEVILEAPNDFVARNNIALALVEQDDPAKKQRALAYAEANYRDNKQQSRRLVDLGLGLLPPQRVRSGPIGPRPGHQGGRRQLTIPIRLPIVAYILYHQDQKWQAKDNPGEHPEERPAVLDEAGGQELYEKVKDAKKPRYHHGRHFSEDALSCFRVGDISKGLLPAHGCDNSRGRGVSWIDKALAQQKIMVRRSIVIP